MNVKTLIFKSLADFIRAIKKGVANRIAASQDIVYFLTQLLQMNALPSPSILYFVVVKYVVKVKVDPVPTVVLLKTFP